MWVSSGGEGNGFAALGPGAEPVVYRVIVVVRQQFADSFTHCIAHRSPGMIL
jgi:hypothetical protein